MGDCERRGGHVKVEFLTDRLPPKYRKLFLACSGTLGAAMLVVCSYAIIVNAYDSYMENEAVAGLVPYPIWPVKSIMAVGVTMYALQAIYNLWALITDNPTNS